MGVWEPLGERGVHLIFAWASRDATGTFSVEVYPVASDDGASFWTTARGWR